MAAWSGKRAVLRNATRQIAATRIQKTWRSFIVDLDSRVEREEAILNQFMNTDDTKVENCPPDPIKNVQKPPVVFGDLVTVKDVDDVIFAEHVEEDARKEGYWLFNRVCSQWFCPSHEKEFYNGPLEEFFSQEYLKDWVDGPYSSYWGEFFEELVQLLEEGSVIVLWGDAKIQRMRKLFPLNKAKLVDLQKMWKLHLAEKKLNRLINLQEEVSAEKNHRVVQLNASAKEFNPNEPWVVPRKEGDDLEMRFMKLLALQELTCTVRQL